jgi:transcriptional regulator with XRE-family HTH domain
MDTLRLGSLIRAVRVRRGLRQRELAGMCEVGQTTISLVERGHGDRLSLATLDQIARSLDIRVDLVARWRGGDAERLLSHRHSELAASVAARIGSEPGWTVLRVRRARRGGPARLACCGEAPDCDRAQDRVRRFQRAAGHPGPKGPAGADDRPRERSGPGARQRLADRYRHVGESPAGAATRGASPRPVRARRQVIHPNAAESRFRGHDRACLLGG